MSSKTNCGRLNAISRMCFVVAVIASVGGIAQAGIVPAAESAFGPGTVVETFENYVGVVQPVDDFQPFLSRLPIGTHFDTGWTITNAKPGADPSAGIMEMALNPYEDDGYGLSYDGGTITPSTALPSGTAFLFHENWVPAGDFPPLGITFDEPVARVGGYTEVSIWFDAGYNGEVLLEAFDEIGQSLGSHQVLADGVAYYADALDTWIGVETDDGQPLIKSVKIYGKSLVLDNFQYQVPEPASLMLLGLGVLTLSRRRS